MTVHRPEDGQEPDAPRLPLHCTWQLAIEASVDEAQIMQLARSFVGGWLATEIRRLPKRCRPPHLVNARELSLYTFKLVRAYCAPGLKPPAERELERMLGFFRAASDRVFELRNGFQRPSASSALRHKTDERSTSTRASAPV
ncbi:MAG: hypothetical protein ACM3X5_01445 [Bacillota bacterium]